MLSLTHFRLCPRSRSIRIALAELDTDVSLAEEQPWQWRPEFLRLNPAGELPVLVLSSGQAVCGAYAVSELLAEAPAVAGTDTLDLFPGDAAARAEVRRLVDWFHGKLDREVTRELLAEKVYAHAQSGPRSGPDAGILRAVRSNLRYHMSYVSHLAHHRRWLAGEAMSFADLAAAAHISVLDYLGELPWEEHPVAKAWYARVKSRPSFRPLLADRLPGLPPPAHYTDLDF